MDRNQKLETILDECLQQLLDGESTIEQCLQRYPEYAADLKPFLLTASAVDRALDVRPSPDFKARARYQLQLKMAELKSPRKASWWSLQPKWALGVMALMLLFIFSGGTILAANSAMPGNILYPVKIATENMAIRLAGTDYGKAELYAVFADRRITELAYIIDKGKTQYVENIAVAYDKNLSEMNELILSSHTGVLAAVAAADESVGMAALPPVTADTNPMFGATTQTPTLAASDKNSSSPPMVTTAATTDDVNHTNPSTSPSQATGTSAARATGNKPTTLNDNGTVGKTSEKAITMATEKDTLIQFIGYNSIHHPEILRELLDKVPEAYKSIIRQMIENANQNNQSTLNKLQY